MSRPWPFVLPLVLVSTACVVASDARPTLDAIVVTGDTTGDRVAPGTALTITLRGTELWDREASVVVERAIDGTVDDAATLTAKFDGSTETQQAEVEWVVGGAFLRRAGRHELTFVARFEGVERRSSAWIVEVDPQIESARFVDRSAGDPIRGGATLAIEVRGRDVLGQPVAIELRRDTAELLTTLSATFEARADGSQIAATTWTVNGTFLDEMQQSEITAVAIFETMRATSPPLSLVLAPRLVAVTPDATAALPGDTVTAVVTGIDVDTRPVVVDIVRTPSSGAPIDEATLMLSFDDSPGMQRAEATYLVPPELAEREGRHEIVFTARYADDVLSSAPVVVDVRPTIRAMTLYRETPEQTRVLVGSGDAPAVDRFIADVEGIALLNRDLVVEIRYDGGVVDTMSMTAAQNHFEITHAPDLDDFSVRERVQLLFVVLMDGTEIGRSTAITLAKRGIRRCYWADASGVELANAHRVDDGDPVRMVASSWGFASPAATWELWEADSNSNDDHVDTFQTSLTGDLSSFDWVANYIDDGVLQSEDEYYFKLRVGPASCESVILAVHE